MMTQTQIIRQLTLDGNVLLLKPKPVRRRKVPNILSKYIVIAEPFCPKEVELPKIKAISETIPEAIPDEPVPEPEPAICFPKELLSIIKSYVPYDHLQKSPTASLIKEGLAYETRACFVNGRSRGNKRVLRLIRPQTPEDPNADLYRGELGLVCYNIITIHTEQEYRDSGIYDEIQRTMTPFGYHLLHRWRSFGFNTDFEYHPTDHLRRMAFNRTWFKDEPFVLKYVSKPEHLPRALNESTVIEGLSSKLGNDIAKLIECFAGSAPNNIPLEVWEAAERYEYKNADFVKGYSLKDKKISKTVLQCPWELFRNHTCGRGGSSHYDHIRFHVKKQMPQFIGHYANFEILKRNGELWKLFGKIVKCTDSVLTFRLKDNEKEYSVKLCNVSKAYKSYEYGYTCVCPTDD
jgi:hypothetical protein